MKHPEHVSLLRGAVPAGSGPWADFGSGEGAFTLALRDLLGPNAEIYSVEKDEARLYQQQRQFLIHFPESNIHFIQADFTQPIDLPPLQGLVMANSLHFFRDKERLLKAFRRYLSANGKLVLVEYNVDSGNPWVPFPISFDSFRPLAARSGYADPTFLTSVPSRFLHEIYSALTFSVADPLSK